MRSKELVTIPRMRYERQSRQGCGDICKILGQRQGDSKMVLSAMKDASHTSSTAMNGCAYAITGLSFVRRWSLTYDAAWHQKLNGNCRSVALHTHRRTDGTCSIHSRCFQQTWEFSDRSTNEALSPSHSSRDQYTTVSCNPNLRDLILGRW